MSVKDDVNLGYSYHLPSGGLRLKIRNAFSHFSDLFSEFNKYIAPAYHHDRCERSVHMRLYNMHKREVFMVFVGLFVMVGLAALIGLAGPPLTLTIQQSIGKNITNHARGPFSMKTPALSAYSQQLWVIGQIVTSNVDDEIFDKSFHVTVDVEGINHDHKPVPVVKADRAHNRTRRIRCSKPTCDEFPVLHLIYLEYTHYILTVQFYGLDSFDQRYHIKDIIFYFKSYNPAFTLMEIWFRFIFLLIAFVASCWFTHTLRKFPSQDWALEQRWMAFLLPLLLLFNNPIFPLNLLVNSCLPSILDSIFQCTFIGGLLLFWLCTFHGIRQNERRFLTFYLPKIIVVSINWLLVIYLTVDQKTSELNDPTFSYSRETSNFQNGRTFFMISSAIYVFYITALILRAYSDLRSMPYFDARLRFVGIMSVIDAGALIFFYYFLFGIDFLLDNFVADLQTTYSTSAKFMIFYSLINFSVYAMAYVYSPAFSTPIEAQITKDNPAFSMINDSDEDVIYGSDEDSRLPLNRSCNHDDSD